MRQLFLLCLLGLHVCSNAQLAQGFTGNFYPSLHTYSRQNADAFSFNTNAAALAGLKSFSAGVFSERRFLLTELSVHTFSIGLPTGSGNFGLSGKYAGGSLHHETSLGLAYGRSAGRLLDVGARFHYLSLNTAGYGAASAVTFDAGAVFHLTETATAGFSVFNPVSQKFGKDGNEQLPAIYTVGVGWDASPQFYAGVEVQNAEEQPLTANIGIQYKMAEKLFVRGGISTAASVYVMGFGVKLKSLRLDASATFHPYLGITPGLMLLYTSSE